MARWSTAVPTAGRRAPSAPSPSPLCYNGRSAGSDLWVAVAWAVGITLVFALLSARKFAQTTAQ